MYRKIRKRTDSRNSKEKMKKKKEMTVYLYREIIVMKADAAHLYDPSIVFSSFSFFLSVGLSRLLLSLLLLAIVD